MAELQKKKILVVDDDPTTRSVLKFMLDAKGFSATALECAEDTLPRIAAEGFDLVLLDVMMPEVSGLDVLRRIREAFSSTDLPVVMLTSLDETADVVEGLKAGANDYITKPPEADILQERIKTQLRIVELTQESLRKKELEAVNAMITTFNHHINTQVNSLLLSFSKIEAQIGEEMYDELESKAVDISHKLQEIANLIENGIESEESESSGAKIYRLAE